MRRRDLLGLLAGSAAGWPFASIAQERRVPTIGFLRSTTEQDSRQDLVALRNGLKAAGFAEHAFTIEPRYADNDRARLHALGAELVQKQVTVLVGNSLAAATLQELTKTIPIVFVSGSDPVRDGLVSSLNHPGGNVTGVVFITGALGAKRVGLLREILPSARSVAALVYPNTPETEDERKELREATQALGLKLFEFDVRTDADIDPAVQAAATAGSAAAIVGSGPFLFSKREAVVASIARHGLVGIYNTGEFADVGGLLSYGTSITEAYRQCGTYVGRILHGEKAGDLPVVQSSKFELVVNMKAAKALKLAIPQNILVAADNVIE